ncbi:hypothetical protein B2J93_6432 [Marssonina coronariae]|uniref:Uncharacterized protein n=1 Tax=Diplocarpon coronariae TaxID=2795749 RepID=A0A218Z3G2_9HELO|nr:hypothetical protein B2J93_6432 [Marssonina coronariae]
MHVRGTDGIVGARASRDRWFPGDQSLGAITIEQRDEREIGLGTGSNQRNPNVNSQQPTMNNEQPTINSQQPKINNRQPTINHQQPTDASTDKNESSRVSILPPSSPSSPSSLASQASTLPTHQASASPGGPQHNSTRVAAGAGAEIARPAPGRDDGVLRTGWRRHDDRPLVMSAHESAPRPWAARAGWGDSPRPGRGDL